MKFIILHNGNHKEIEAETHKLAAIKYAEMEGLSRGDIITVDHFDFRITMKYLCKLDAELVEDHKRTVKGRKNVESLYQEGF